ncbi:MAG TPA: TetR/AcrR family transcriptional regulator [Pseudonocardiaceae bacterium]
MTEAVPSRSRRLPRAVREQQMLDAAVAVFSRRGYHSASMDEIAEVAGISKPMVYAYLGAKEDLFAACLRREADSLVAAVVGAATGGGADLPPEEVLWRGLRAFFGFVHEHRDSWAVLHGQARGEFGAEFEAIRARVIDVVAMMLTQARTERTVGTEADLAAFAHALVGAAESLAGWMVDHPGESPDAMASRLMNFVWVGFHDLLAGAVWRPAG